MGSNKGINFFLELNDHSIGVAKASSTNAAPSIEEFREACLDDAASVKEAINVITGGNAGEPVAIHLALRPAKRFFDLATADDARNHKTITAIEDFVAKSVSIKSEDTHTTAVYGRTGQPFDGSSKDQWFAATTTKESASAALGKVKEWNLKSDGFESATISLIGSVQAALKAANQSTPVVCWDIGETSSDLFLIGAQGIEGARRIGFGYDQVAESIQTEIQLKFKAAAAKLFFNERYDFATNAPKIAKRVATLLDSEITKLTAESANAPTEFFCAGLPTKQCWFTKELAASLQLKEWKADFSGWSKQAGVTLAGDLAGLSCSPTWLGVLGLAAAHTTNNLVWHPVWDRTNAPAAASTSAAPAAAPAKAQPEAKKDAKSASTPIPAPAKGKQEPTPKKTAAVAATPAKSVLEKKLPSKKEPALAKMAKAPWNNPAMIKRIAIAAGAAILLGGGFFYFQAVEKQKEAALAAQRVAEQRAAADAEARREAELKALAEAEARAAAEREAVESAKAARKKAEEEARLREIERQRLLNARGSIEIITEPKGANVSVGNLASQTTPASFSDLRLGSYTAEISMDGYDPTTVEIEVKEDEVTQVGPIRLARHVGTLVIDTKPVGLSYELRPVGAGLFTSSTQKRIGLTPHTISDLPTDEYVVTIQRDGWPDVTENVVIKKGETARINRDLSGGTVVINTDPSGAEVFADGESLGTTPLTLTAVKPGEVAYTITRNLYHSATINGKVAPEKTTTLDVALESIEYIAKSTELDRWPSPINRIEPTVPNPERFAGKSVVLDVTISDDGVPMEIMVAESDDEELALYCVDAVSQWEFRPGKVGRKEVWTRVSIPFKF